ncbi:MAG: glycosyltransferase [Winogradskyella sp.]|nr:MAG: glycosyltransferase [Winogradskyella sp.]
MKRNLKICHLTSVHHRDDIRIFKKQCVSLAEQNNYEVNLIVADNLPDEKTNGVNIYTVGKDASRLKSIIKTSKRIYKKALEIDADVYHFHDPELLFVGYFLKKKKKKVIYDAHEDIPRMVYYKDYIRKPFKRITEIVLESFENFLSKKMDYIIGATPHIASRFSKINNAICVNNYAIFENKDITERGERIPNEICFVGGISWVRGLHNVVKSLPQVEGVKLNLAGNFSDEKYKKEFTSSEGWKKIEYYGLVDYEKAEEIRKKTSVGIVTYLECEASLTSQPNKLFEYMASGLAIVCSNFKLWKEIVEVNNCGICVDPENIKEIAESIDYLIKNPQIAKKMGENGINAVKSKYNWSKENEKLQELYQGILNEVLEYSKA